MPCVCLVSRLERLGKNLNHKREKVLERFLMSELETLWVGAFVYAHDVGLFVHVNVLSNSTERSSSESTRGMVILRKIVHLTVVTRTSALSGS